MTEKYIILYQIKIKVTYGEQYWLQILTKANYV